MSLADARERAHQVILDATRGGDPAGEKQVEKGAPTFEALTTEYLERYAEHEKRSWERDETMLRKLFLPRWGRRKAHDIQRRDVIKLLDEARDRGLTTQVNRILALVRKIYNWGVGRDIVQANPCLQVHTGIAEKVRERVLSESEIRAVWAASETLKAPIDAMFKLRLLTMQRGGEVECMRWSELDLDAGWWTIPEDVAKNGKSHRVWLSKPALELILEQKARSKGEPWVFPSPSRRGKFIDNVQKAKGRVTEASGVEFTLHDMSRTAASHTTGVGVPRFVVGRVLNNSEPGATGIYDRHGYDVEKR